MTRGAREPAPRRHGRRARGHRGEGGRGGLTLHRRRVEVKHATSSKRVSVLVHTVMDGLGRAGASEKKKRDRFRSCGSARVPQPRRRGRRDGGTAKNRRTTGSCIVGRTVFAEDASTPTACASGRTRTTAGTARVSRVVRGGFPFVFETRERLVSRASSSVTSAAVRGAWCYILTRGLVVQRPRGSIIVGVPH